VTKFELIRSKVIRVLVSGDEMTIKQLVSFVNRTSDLDDFINEAYMRRVVHSLPDHCRYYQKGKIVAKPSRWASGEDLQAAIMGVVKSLDLDPALPLLWDTLRPHLQRVLVITDCALWESMDFAVRYLAANWKWMNTAYGLMLRLNYTPSHWETAPQ
jgi:hypothetical protein